MHTTSEIQTIDLLLRSNLSAPRLLVAALREIDHWRQIEHAHYNLQKTANVKRIACNTLTSIKAEEHKDENNNEIANYDFFQ